MLKIRTEDGEREVLEDGERITVGAMLMDSQQKAVASTVVFDAAGHKPGSLLMTDAQIKPRVDAYDAYTARVSNAWKNPPSVVANVTDDKQQKQPVTDTAKAYQTYDADISNRWKSKAA